MSTIKKLLRNAVDRLGSVEPASGLGAFEKILRVKLHGQDGGETREGEGEEQCVCGEDAEGGRRGNRSS